MKAVLFDGTVLNFPEGTDPAVISRVAKEQTLMRKQQDPNAAPQPTPNASPQDPNLQAQEAGIPIANPNAPGADGNSPSPAFQQALAQLHQAAGSLKDAPIEDRDRLVRANLEATKINNMQGDKGLLRRAAEAIPGGATGGFADEAYSALVGGPMRMLTDQVGYGEGYKRSQALQAEQERRRGSAANLIGNVAGGTALGSALTTGGLTAGANGITAATPSWGGLTLTGRAASGLGKVGAAGAEGALYGGAYGAGNSSEGNRLADAGWGALTGALTGAAVEGAGQGVSKLLAPKQGAPAPATEELAAQATALYNKARDLNVSVKPEAVNRLANNVEFAAGRINVNNRPETAGIVDDILAWKDKPLDLEVLGEMQTQIRDTMKGAKPQDREFLRRIQTVLKGFADNVTPSQATGDIKGFQYVKEAGKLWAQKSKAAEVEKLLDLADVDTGQYTQSGMANTIRLRMKSLYKQIKNGKSDSAWTKDEIAIIRTMAKGGSNSKTVNFLAKFAPRGVISATLPQTLGGLSTMVLGPAGFAMGPAVSAIGHVAGNAADRGAIGAATALRDAAARGYVQQLPQLPNYLRPLISGATAGAVGMRPQGLLGSR